MSNRETLIIHNSTLSGNTLTCTYNVGSEEFKSSYTFPRTIDKKTPQLQKLCEWVTIITSLGLFSIDYFENIKTDFELSEQEAQFFEKLIFLGLGEFRYSNKIPINTKTVILGKHATHKATPAKKSIQSQLKPLLLNGGGKDGSVSALLLKEAGIDFTWFNRGESTAQKNVIKTWSAPSVTVIRTLDPKRKNRKYSGHRPISAGIAFLALLTAHAYNYSAVITSNELSANEGNFTLDGFDINHQYSKSIEFERDLQNLLSLFDIQEQYFSLLRPLHELQIATIAARLTDKQLQAITSCNNGTQNGSWCMHCAKCAFVVLIMTAASPAAADKIWGSGAINNPGLFQHFEALLDPMVDKPLECVGTLQECQLAAYMILRNPGTMLKPATRQVLSSYARSRDSDLLHEWGDSLIPEGYKNVVELMKARIKR